MAALDNYGWRQKNPWSWYNPYPPAVSGSSGGTSVDPVIIDVADIMPPVVGPNASMDITAGVPGPNLDERVGLNEGADPLTVAVLLHLILEVRWVHEGPLTSIGRNGTVLTFLGADWVTMIYDT